jgi:hypothetical protein
MHKKFRDLIRDLIEVYVDDIVVNIKSHASLLDDIALVFDKLHSTHTKLNLDKCAFRSQWASCLVSKFHIRELSLTRRRSK